MTAHPLPSLLRPLLGFWRRYHLYALHGLQTLLSYRISFALTAVTSGASLLAQLYLWRAIYQQNPGAALAGYTLADMSSYLLMSNLLYLALDNRVEHDVAADVMHGDIVVHFVRPVNYTVLRFFSALPVMLCNFFVVGLPLCLLGALCFGMRWPAPADLALFALSAAMALAISFLINTLLGTAAFVTTNIWGLQIMKTALVGILSGYLIPLSFFGPTLRTVAAWLPFPSMLYAPLTLFLGKYQGWADAGAILGLQAFWVLVLALACAALWRRLAARLEILGG